MRISRWMLVGGSAAIVAAVALAGSMGVSKAPAATAVYKAALVSDIAGFNDNGFNKLQLVGLNKAMTFLNGKDGQGNPRGAIPLVSNGQSDYGPNYSTAVNSGANIIIAAGFLLGDTMNTYSQQYPGIKFAITDDSAAFVGGRKNEMGITYKTQQGGCMVGVLAAKEAQSMGHKVIGVVGGIKIPPVDSYIAGYKFCAQRAVPGTTVLIQYSNSFTDEAACATVAQNEIGQNAQVIFQVAGGCGDGALKYAGNHGKWGIGVDADEYNVSPGHILTSALKKTDVGVYNIILKAHNKQWNGGHNISLNLTNKGVGVGKINPSVPAAWKTLMNTYKTQMINGSLKPPAVLK